LIVLEDDDGSSGGWGEWGGEEDQVMMKPEPFDSLG